MVCSVSGEKSIILGSGYFNRETEWVDALEPRGLTFVKRWFESRGFYRIYTLAGNKAFVLNLIWYFCFDFFFEKKLMVFFRGGLMLGMIWGVWEWGRWGGRRGWEGCWGYLNGMTTGVELVFHQNYIFEFLRSYFEGKILFVEITSSTEKLSINQSSWTRFLSVFWTFVTMPHSLSSNLCDPCHPNKTYHLLTRLLNFSPFSPYLQGQN